MPVVGDKRATLILVLVLCFAFVSIPQIGLVQAQSGTVYIMADGTVDGTDKIRKDGSVYTFLDDIIGSIVVETDDVVIDGAGYTLQEASVLNLSGITLLQRRNVSIRNLTITGFSIGIFFEDSVNNSIRGNTIIYNNCGICLQSFSTSNNLYGNHIVLNYRFGIYIFNSSNNTIVENIVEKNAEFGIMLIYSSNNNRIHHNSFINNLVQAYAFDSVDFWDITPPPDSVNIWDNGYPLGGNFWSDYVYVDDNGGPSQNLTGNDGIWDYPYVIDPLNQDNYPLVELVIIPEFPSWIILPLFIVASLVVLRVRNKFSKKGLK